MTALPLARRGMRGTHAPAPRQGMRGTQVVIPRPEGPLGIPSNEPRFPKGMPPLKGTYANPRFALGMTSGFKVRFAIDPGAKPLVGGRGPGGPYRKGSPSAGLGRTDPKKLIPPGRAHYPDAQDSRLRG